MIGLRYTGMKRLGIYLTLYHTYKSIHLTPLDSYKFSPSDNTSADACKYYMNLPRHLCVEVILDKELSVNTPSGPRDEGNDHSNGNDKEVVIPDDPKDKDGNVDQDKASTDAEVTTEPVDIEIKSEVDGINLSELTDNELSEYIESNLSREQMINLLRTIDANAPIGPKTRSNTLLKLITNHDHKEVVNALATMNN